MKRSVAGTPKRAVKRITERRLRQIIQEVIAGGDGPSTANTALAPIPDLPPDVIRSTIKSHGRDLYIISREELDRVEQMEKDLIDQYEAGEIDDDEFEDADWPSHDFRHMEDYNTLDGLDLRSVDFSGLNLTDITFTGCDARGVDFTRTRGIASDTFANCDVTGAKFPPARRAR
jgi:hypothetical protein